MVKKLLKHEATYYSRTLFIYAIVLFVLALFTRLLMFFETDMVIYTLAQSASFLLFGFAVFACYILATVISVFRFYKNLFTSEGYLSFALPVTTNQHIFAKLISATIYNLIVYILSVFAFLITISGDIYIELVDAGLYLLNFAQNQLPDVHLTLHLIFYIIEFVFLTITSTVFNLLLYYACIAIGQTAKKNRILLAVGVYFGYITITQMFRTVVSMAISILAANTELIMNLTKYYIEHPFTSIHISLVFSIVGAIVMSVICYVITRVTISRKLNLE